MFETLDDQMKHDTEAESTKTQRILRRVAALLVTVLVLGGLYFAVRLLD